ncbi:MAG: hypothetical protein QM598_05790 [Protaetiibacter sp.]
MNPQLLAFIPGALIAAGFAVLLVMAAPRRLRVADALSRHDAIELELADEPAAAPGSRSDRIGNWLYARSGGIPGFTAPTRLLDLLEISPAAYYYRKLVYALFGLLAPAVLTLLLSALTGQAVVLPLILSPLLALAFWFIPDGQIRTLAVARKREFTRFVTVYLELVAVALLGNSTPDQALSSAANVADSWVFQRIRREYRLADLTRISKWQALERLGDAVDVPALGEMARVMRMSDAQVGVRDQLRAACDKLRAQVTVDDATEAERVSGRLQVPVMLTLIPLLALVMIPTVLNLLTINGR